MRIQPSTTRHTLDVHTTSHSDQGQEADSVHLTDQEAEADEAGRLTSTGISRVNPESTTMSGRGRCLKRTRCTLSKPSSPSKVTREKTCSSSSSRRLEQDRIALEQVNASRMNVVTTEFASTSMGAIVDAILAVGLQRNQLLGELRIALESGDNNKVWDLARQLCGLNNHEESNRANSRIN